MKEKNFSGRDLHNEQPLVTISLDRVGVTGVKRRLIVKRKNPYQLFINLNMYIQLPKDIRGANMSRFLRALDEISSEVSSLEEYVISLANKLKEEHGSDAVVEASALFPYEVVRPDNRTEERVFPFKVTYNTAREEIELEVKIDAMSACPCSYENAGIPHTQRIYVTIAVRGEKSLNIPTGRFVDVVNIASSSPIYYVLRRDEEAKLLKDMKLKFNEDIIRSIVAEMKTRPYFRGLISRIEIESMESVHPHNVYVKWEGVI